MIRRYVSPFIAVFTLSLVAVGCGSDDAASTTEDAITPQEVAEGDAWVASGSGVAGQHDPAFLIVLGSVHRQCGLSR